MAGKKAPEEKPATDQEMADQAPCDDARQPEVAAAEEAVRLAKEQLKEAQQAYRRIRTQAADQLKQIRETSVGDVVDATLKGVKRYPGPSMIIAILAGFFLGRLFRR